MKRIVLKRYVIHILAVPAINADAFDLPMEQNALILCCDRTNRYIEGNNIKNKLVLPFSDVELSNLVGAFNGAHARAVIRFLKELPESVTDLYICCSKGGSRSSGLAAALLKGSGRPDKAVWYNPYYVPNKLVYKKMCNELGFIMPWIRVRFKSFVNAIQFKKYKRRGGVGKYERWQIIF